MKFKMLKLYFMKKLFLLIICMGATLSSMAQKFDPYKGTFVKETPNAYFEANINLYEKTIEGSGDGTGLCYGTIIITNQRGEDGFDIVNTDSLDSPEPNIWVVPYIFPDMDPIRVSLDYDINNQTITLNDWEGGVFINDLTLKKK